MSGLPASSLHRSLYTMQTSGHPVIAYAFTIFVLLLHAIDRVFQLKERSQKYLILQCMFLGIILLVDASLIFYIEFEISKQKMTWFPALWALLGFSIVLSLSIGVSETFLEISAEIANSQ